MLKDLPLSWAVAVAPDNSIFITHRAGNISRVVPIKSNDEVTYQSSVIKFKPDDLLVGGQGGLLDIIFHPEFSVNGWIYVSYSARKEKGNIVKVVRFTLDKTVVSQLETIFELATIKSTPVHYGGRLAFSADNALLLSSGDGFDYREQAQVIDSHLGKILRMDDQGNAHPSNPYYSQGGNAAYVLSRGHRNPQGLVVINTQTDGQMVVAHEHGPAGGDEVNIIKSGINYGWPVVTNGKDYSGASISPFKAYPNMQLPDLDWTPSIAPSGMTYYFYGDTHSLYDDTHSLNKNTSLQGKLLITSLKFKQIYAIDVIGSMLGHESILLREPVVRLRDIETDNVGTVWVLSDGEPASLYQLKSN